jgi:SAM-dependent methyltransferase
MNRSVKTYLWGDDPDFIGPQLYYRFSLITDKLRQFIKQGYILDAGCGDGFLSLRLCRLGYDLIAIDNSDICITNVKRKLAAANLTHHLKTEKGNLIRLPFKRSTFDAVICSDVLEHITEDVKVIDEFFRVIKPGGLCIVTVPGKPELWHEIDDISGHVRRYQIEDIYNKFKKSGFDVTDCYYWGFPLNTLWHRFIFKPLILYKMKYRKNVTYSTAYSAGLIKSNLLQIYLSKIFAFDRLFDWTGLGEFLILVAEKAENIL